METKVANNYSKENSHRYGLLSMLAMVIGIVVGSGIYVVNGSLYDSSNGSTGISMISWILVSLIVLFMLISFLEISSITVLKKENGTINNWSRRLFNPNFSKYIGIFFPLIYYPILIGGFAMIMSSETMSNFSRFDVLDNSKEVWLDFIYTTLIAFLILNLIYGINSFTSKPGKTFQAVGTVIKLIPIFTVVIIGFIAIVGLYKGAPEANSVFDVAQNYSDTRGEESVFILILALSPTVMFSYDGFLFAASLQNESKKPSTYKTAVISGIIFIILIYILMSFFSLAYGDKESGNFSVSYILGSLFPSASNWLTPLVSTMIIISVATGISGNTIAQNRMIADVSASNYISDPDGKMIARNKALVPQRSSEIAWVVTIITFLIFTSLDLFSTLIYVNDKNAFDGTNSLPYAVSPILNSTLNTIVLIAYTFYAIIIIGGISNRKTKKVEVEKNKLFLPAAYIAVVSIFVILIVYSIDIFSPGNLIIKDHGIEYGKAYLTFNYSFNIIMFILLILIIALVPLYLSKEKNRLSKEQLLKKEKILKAYNENKIDPRYL